MDFEFLEHTADLKFRAYGGGFEEALVNSAQALRSAFIGEQDVGSGIVKSFSVSGFTVEELVHDFLADLIFLFETEHFVASTVSVSVDDALNLTADCIGGVLDFDVNTVETEVKAVTYHDMFVGKEGSRFVIQVVCDI